jgi:hypothetical protein
MDKIERLADLFYRADDFDALEKGHGTVDGGSPLSDTDRALLRGATPEERKAAAQLCADRLRFDMDVEKDAALRQAAVLDPPSVAAYLAGDLSEEELWDEVDARATDILRRDPPGRCSRCGRPHLGEPDWNATVQGGRPVEHVCPDCQTLEENTEAVINEATTEYGRDGQGRLVGRPRL